MKKKLYENPESELITVHFEGNFCTTGVPGGAGGDDTIVDDEDDLS